MMDFLFDPLFDIAKRNPRVASQPRIPAGSKGGGQFLPDGPLTRAESVRLSRGRVFNGEAVDVENKLSKLEVGAVGEKIVEEWLHKEGLKDARTLNVNVNNFPVDLIQNHNAIEVKTGLVSNGKSAQHWRATIGQPGVEERRWLKTASPEAKKAWNLRKQEQILARKNTALKKISKDLKRPVKGVTYGLILNPDTKRADIYRFDGFHLRIPWNGAQAKAGYLGTVKYD